MRRIIPLLILLTLFLTGCAQEEQGFFITVYYASSENVEDKSLAIGKEQRRVQDGSGALETALAAVMERPLDLKLRSTFGEGVSLISYDVEDGEIKLHMSDSYADMPEGDKVIARACLVLTLCALEGIDTVSIFIGDVPDAIGIRAEDIEVENAELNPHEKRIKLYFAHPSGTLKEERRDIRVDGERELALYVMEELLSGPRDKELYQAVPEGTRLLSLTVEGRTCIVDLSREFLENANQSELEEELAVYSVVNSLTALTTIDRVQFLIEGKRLENYYSIEIFNPIEGNTEIMA